MLWELRGRNVTEESNLPPIKQHPTDPNHKWTITNGLTTTNNNLPPPIHQTTLEMDSPTPVQFSSQLDTDQGDMIEETIKQVMHKLLKAIVWKDLWLMYS